MGVTTTQTNKPFNPRGNDQSPKGYNRASLFSGKALDFDGVNDSVDLDGFTMAGNVATIVFQAKFENDQYLFDIDTQRFVIRNTSSEGFRVFNSDSFTEYGETKRSELGFYSIVSDGTTQRVYYNGAQLGSDKTIVALDWSSATKVKIASNNTGTNNFFDGQIAGFKIFNTALTAAQVADLYNNPEKVVPTGVDNTALKLWLPMMEGAGTTAYDGSGNGNHGTIAGATYVNGIGAPVAQSAVIDWNKGSNLVPDVNDFNSANEVTTTTGLADDPAGRSNAVRFTKTTDTTPRYGFQTCGSATLLANTDYVISLFYKYDGHAFASSIEYNNSGHFDLSWACNLNIAASGVTISSTANCTGKVVEYSNDWYRVDVELTTGASPSGNPQYLVKMQGNTGTSLLVAYAQLEQASSVGPLVPTFATAQTSEVLLPQGLTTGRDITGVNLFENVRKQGALNLDGNSWALVHDNLSNDIEDEVTLECWYYHVETTAINHLIGKRDGSNEWLRIYSASSNSIRLERNGGNSSSDVSITENAWNHIVTTIDDSDNMKVYINGTQQLSTASFAPWSMNNSAPVSIAAWATSTTAAPAVNSRTTGQLAQPRIYNRALTAEEVQRNYNAGKNTYTN